MLWPFDIFCGNLVNFSRFGKLYKEKSGILAVKYASKAFPSTLQCRGSQISMLKSNTMKQTLKLLQSEKKEKCREKIDCLQKKISPALALSSSL
jgi:hypothetical protein